MDIEYKWEVQSLEKATVEGINDVVLQTYWKLTATSVDGISINFEGATPLNFNPDTEEFIKFVDLTEEVVVEWIQLHLKEEDSLDDLLLDLTEEINYIRLYSNREEVGAENLPWQK